MTDALETMSAMLDCLTEWRDHRKKLHPKEPESMPQHSDCPRCNTYFRELCEIISGDDE